MGNQSQVTGLVEVQFDLWIQGSKPKKKQRISMVQIAQVFKALRNITFNLNHKA